MKNRSHDRVLCGATNRQGLPCARPAGWGTKHAGSGRCKLHGGNAGIADPSKQRGNKRAEKHGLYSMINLTPEDIEFLKQYPTDPEDNIAFNLGMAGVRFRRMMALAAELQHTGDQEILLSAESALSAIQGLQARFVESLIRKQTGDDPDQYDEDGKPRAWVVTDFGDITDPETRQQLIDTVRSIGEANVRRGATHGAMKAVTT